MKSATVRDAADLLNEMLRLEPRAVSDLLRLRVPFEGEELADHPTVQVSEGTDGGFTLGFVGVLNGLLGNGERLAIMVDDDFYENPAKLVERVVAYESFPVVEA